MSKPEPEPEPEREATERPARARKPAPAAADHPPDRAHGAKQERPAQSTAAADPPPSVPATERAEKLLDQAGQRFGHWISEVSHRLRVGTARAREEAEDIWAEAQSIRHTPES